MSEGVWTITESEFKAELDRERDRVLAAVRRVVEGEASKDEAWPVARIRARLDALDPPRLSTEAEARAAMGDGQRLVKMRVVEP